MIFVSTQVRKVTGLYTQIYKSYMCYKSILFVIRFEIILDLGIGEKEGNKISDLRNL